MVDKDEYKKEFKKKVKMGTVIEPKGEEIDEDE